MNLDTLFNLLVWTPCKGGVFLFGIIYISGSCKTVKGYHWRFATEEERSGELVYAE